MQSRAEYYRTEAEKCREQAKKAGSATAMFALLELADQMLEKAAKAERDGDKPET